MALFPVVCLDVVVPPSPSSGPTVATLAALDVEATVPKTWTMTLSCEPFKGYNLYVVYILYTYMIHW